MSTMTVRVYGRSVGVNQNNPALSFHTKLDLPYIKVMAVIGNKRGIWREEFKVTSQELAEQQIKEVMKFFNDTRRSESECEREFVALYTEDAELAKWEDGEGMSGWLDPEGNFYPCGFGEHVLYPLDVFNKREERISLKCKDEMEELTDTQHIPMSIDERSSNSFIGILGDITPQQVTWFDRYFYKLSRPQRSALASAASKQGIKLKHEW